MRILMALCFFICLLGSSEEKISIHPIQEITRALTKEDDFNLILEIKQGCLKAINLNRLRIGIYRKKHLVHSLVPSSYITKINFKKRGYYTAKLSDYNGNILDQQRFKSSSEKVNVKLLSDCQSL